MIKRPYVNKRGRLMLGEEQKKVLKKQKGECFSALLFPLAKAALSIFSSGKKTCKKKQNNYCKRRRSKKSYSTTR